MIIINKKAVKYAIITILFATSIFLTIYFAYQSRLLELQEITEQIEKFGFYKTDIHISVEREKKSLLYNFLAVFPLLVMTCTTIGILVNDTFSKKNENKER